MVDLSAARVEKRLCGGLFFVGKDTRKDIGPYAKSKAWFLKSKARSRTIQYGNVRWNRTFLGNNAPQAHTKVPLNTPYTYTPKFVQTTFSLQPPSSKPYIILTNAPSNVVHYVVNGGRLKIVCANFGVYAHARERSGLWLKAEGCLHKLWCIRARSGHNARSSFIYMGNKYFPSVTSLPSFSTQQQSVPAGRAEATPYHRV